MKIYVCTHKKFDYNLPHNYQYIQVNADNNEKIYDLRDNLGENISKKNQFYCELTACYWIWKNDKENDVVGLMHYRRYFTTNRFSSSKKYFLNEKRVRKELVKNQFIATKMYKTNISVKEHLLMSVREKDYLLLEKVIKDYFPEYKRSFKKVMEGKKSYLLNMFICTKENWDRYYEWLFSVFEKLEPLVNMEGYTTQEQRLFGFLSERLFTVYIEKNNFSVKSFSVNIIGETKMKTLINKAFRIFHIRSH